MKKKTSLFDALFDGLLTTISMHDPEVPLTKITLEPSSNFDFGDLSTNALMVLKKHPCICQEVIRYFENHPLVVSAQQKNGFLNIRLKRSALVDLMDDILQKRQTFKSYVETSHPLSINVEFVSVNPTGPLHAGHARNAVLGDVLSRLLEFAGHKVTREYYVNDAGGQIDALYQSTLLRFEECHGRVLKEDDFSKDMYRGDYLIPLAKYLSFNDVEKGKESLVPRIIEWMMEDIKKDLNALGIVMDVYTHERFITQNRYIDRAVERLQKQNDLYMGTLPAPKEHVGAYDEREQLLFRSTCYGDDIDRPLQKPDGSWTYFAGDIGYHLYKVEKNYDRLITVLGADHGGYVTRLQAVVKALSSQKQNIDIQICQLVNFVESGVPLRMSKRAGCFVTVADLLQKVGKDAVRFMMLSRAASVGIDFDFEKVLATTKDNPLFYIQYAHARICSVTRRAAEAGITPHVSYDIDEKEAQIILNCLFFIRVLNIAIERLEPHRITQYLYDLASLVHQFWTTSRILDNEHLAQTQRRLCLLNLVRCVIAQGLSILGIDALEQM